jgi:hypothetical protein
MATNHVHNVRPRTERAPLCSPGPPPCPVCGGLECLCRPRWVAGQIVSEADLNRLDRYIIGKQRLHNRHLFGTGVVCGLIVHCHPCNTGSVTVSPGYALGPCGDDIVVCAQDTVDVCALIRCCKQREDVECRPYGDDRGCREVEEEWVLAIRYDEHAARTEPRAHGKACPSCGCAGGGCGCGGGGHDTGGCGCAGGGNAGRPMPRTAPVECAPTITCEGYRYEVFKAPGRRDDARRPRGALFERYSECVDDLLEALRVWLAERAANPQLACSRLKAALVAHYGEHGTSRCHEVRQLCSIVCSPEPGEAEQRLLALLVGAVQDCLCDALLPPCPEPTADPRVPLASFTVSGTPCRVVKVCNWTPLRPILVTFPNLLYWLSIFPQGATVRDLLHRLCCEPLLPRLDPRSVVAPFTVSPVFAAAAPGPEAAEPDLFRKWLIDRQPDPRDVLEALNLAPRPDEVESLRREVAALREEVARLRRER